MLFSVRLVKLIIKCLILTYIDSFKFKRTSVNQTKNLQDQEKNVRNKCHEIPIKTVYVS